MDDMDRARAALAAGAVTACLPYLTLKLNWLAGGHLGIPEGSPLRDGGAALWSVNALTVAMDATVLLLVLALVRPFGQRLPGLLLALPLWGAAGLLGPIAVAFPLQAVTGVLRSGGGSGDGDPGRLLEGWVWTLVYTGFTLQALALGGLFALYVRRRWGALLRSPLRTGARGRRRLGRLRRRRPRGAARRGLAHGLRARQRWRGRQTDRGGHLRRVHGAGRARHGAAAARRYAPPLPRPAVADADHRRDGLRRAGLLGRLAAAGLPVGRRPDGGPARRPGGGMDVRRATAGRAAVHRTAGPRPPPPGGGPVSQAAGCRFPGCRAPGRRSPSGHRPDGSPRPVTRQAGVPEAATHRAATPPAPTHQADAPRAGTAQAATTPRAAAGRAGGAGGGPQPGGTPASRR
ncbi:hypothetical protein ACWV95_08970 [Streptomyces albus]